MITGRLPSSKIRREVMHRQTVARAMKYVPGLRRVALPLLLAAAIQASAGEHPGILHQDDNCSTCHADKINGKSVHSAMQLSCTACHIALTQGDMTILSLMMPKEQICFACHEKSKELQRHSPIGGAQCVHCHDAHSSNRRMLLREQPSTRSHDSGTLVRKEDTSHKARRSTLAAR